MTPQGRIVLSSRQCVIRSPSPISRPPQMPPSPRPHLPTLGKEGSVSHHQQKESLPVRPSLFPWCVIFIFVLWHCDKTMKILCRQSSRKQISSSAAQGVLLRAAGGGCWFSRLLCINPVPCTHYQNNLQYWAEEQCIKVVQCLFDIQWSAAEYFFPY